MNREKFQLLLNYEQICYFGPIKLILSEVIIVNLIYFRSTRLIQLIPEQQLTNNLLLTIIFYVERIIILLGLVFSYDSVITK